MVVVVHPVHSVPFVDRPDQENELEAQKGTEQGQRKPRAIDAKLATIAPARTYCPSWMQQHNRETRCGQVKSTPTSSQSEMQDSQQEPNYNQCQGGQGKVGADGVVDLKWRRANKRAVRIARRGA